MSDANGSPHSRDRPGALAAILERRKLIGASNLPPDLRHTLLELAIYIGANDTCFPTQDTLARQLGIEKRTLRDRLHKLRDIVSREPHGRHTTYRVDWERLGHTNSGGTPPHSQHNSGGRVPQLFPNSGGTPPPTPAVECRDTGGTPPRTHNIHQEHTSKTHYHENEGGENYISEGDDSPAWPSRIPIADLRNAQRVEELYRIAIAIGWAGETPIDRRGFHAAALQALTGKNPPGLFVNLAKRQAWKIPPGKRGAIADDADDKARKRIKALDDGWRDRQRQPRDESRIPILPFRDPNAEPKPASRQAALRSPIPPRPETWEADPDQAERAEQSRRRQIDQLQKRIREQEARAENNPPLPENDDGLRDSPGEIFDVDAPTLPAGSEPVKPAVCGNAS